MAELVEVTLKWLCSSCLIATDDFLALASFLRLVDAPGCSSFLMASKNSLVSAIESFLPC